MGRVVNPLQDKHVDQKALGRDEAAALAARLAAARALPKYTPDSWRDGQGAGAPQHPTAPTAPTAPTPPCVSCLPRSTSSVAMC